MHKEITSKERRSRGRRGGQRHYEGVSFLGRRKAKMTDEMLDTELH